MKRRNLQIINDVKVHENTLPNANKRKNGL